VRVTDVPLVYAWVQSVPQRIPDGDEEIEPTPETAVVRVYVTGLVMASDALQLAVVPPLEPRHDHVQGPEPETAVGVPVLQRFVVGMLERVAPLLVPQVPLVGVGVGAVMVHV
jgi:hypothetical protein